MERRKQIKRDKLEVSKKLFDRIHRKEKGFNCENQLNRREKQEDTAEHDMKLPEA